MNADIAEFSKARSRETGREYWGKALFCDPPNHYPGIFSFYLIFISFFFSPCYYWLLFGLAIQYNWARQEFPQFIQEDRRVFVSMDGNLYFTSLEKSDEATYSCNVQSVISSTGRTGPFFTLSVTTFCK